MADAPHPTNGTSTGAAAGTEPARAQISVLGQYVRDLSFENPSAPQSLQPPSEAPQMRVEVNVNARPIENKVYESQIQFSASAKIGESTLYALEMVYGGVFRLENVPEEAIRPILFINCPTLLFPFVRRLAADLTREGGFSPLLLDPIDFGGLYQKNMKETAARQQAQPEDVPT